MMITETEIVARFVRLEVHVLRRWIASGWVRPKESGSGFLFDEADVARTHLICDLSYEMELRDDELAMVISLVDQLNGARSVLRAMAAAVQNQPPQVRDAIMAEMGELLGTAE
jgi:chaperone modulatory protein CbpM